MPLLMGGTFRRDERNRMTPLAHVKLQFFSENGGPPKQVNSGRDARFQIRLAKGRYRVNGFHNGQLVYSTGSGIVIVRSPRQTFNMIAKRVNTSVRDASAGAIERKWRALGGNSSPLGRPVSGILRSRDRQSSYRNFQGGTITHQHNGGQAVHREAFAIWGAIHHTWRRKGGINGLGCATTDEISTPQPRDYGKMNEFEHGVIYWTVNTGAIALPAAVKNAWDRSGGTQGDLGFPVPKTWRRNLAAQGLNYRSREIYLFEGGAIRLRPNGRTTVIKHGEVSANRFNRGRWVKRGEINRKDDWVTSAQGIVYDPGRRVTDRRWYITCNTKTTGFQKGKVTKLDKHFKTVFGSNNIRDNFGTRHVGGLDLWQNRLYVACEEPTAGGHPFVAILDKSLRKVGKTRLHPNEAGHDPRSSGKMPWCAINPADGLFYTSDFDNVSAVHGYDMNRGWRYTKSIHLDRTIQRVQGGDFTDNGHLFLASDDRDDQNFAHIMLFNGVRGHLMADLPVARKFGHFFQGDEEIEGLCFAKGVPYGRPTALHTIVIEKDAPRESWIKHWEIPTDQLRWL
ncbi:MAG: hypothetical protein AAF828_05045 [Bacteroidota bacterium]